MFFPDTSIGIQLGNLLVSDKDPEDIILIDCGGYHNNGFRVTDLALIEADLKLVLMGVDQTGYGDIHPHSLDVWVPLEAHAIETGLRFNSGAIRRCLQSLEKSLLVRRVLKIRRRLILHDQRTLAAAAKAYKLIALVRAQARELSHNTDGALTTSPACSTGRCAW